MNPSRGGTLLNKMDLVHPKEIQGGLGLIDLRAQNMAMALALLY
jgi:hypothetical protein